MSLNLEVNYYFLKTGMQWLYMPDIYGCDRAIHNSYKD
ncbi:hypothetical protein BBG19_0652 [Francisella sp. MA067296]|nr:hypothetical protein BBG19_0652 [Francisella sp. MA067296]